MTNLLNLRELRVWSVLTASAFCTGRDYGFMVEIGDYVRFKQRVSRVGHALHVGAVIFPNCCSAGTSVINRATLFIYWSTNRAQALIDAMESIEKDYESLRGALPKSEYQDLGDEDLSQLLRTFNDPALNKADGDNIFWHEL